MDQKYNISEILDAVNDIHRSEPKKKTKIIGWLAKAKYEE